MNRRSSLFCLVLGGCGAASSTEPASAPSPAPEVSRSEVSDPEPFNDGVDESSRRAPTRTLPSGSGARTAGPAGERFQTTRITPPPTPKRARHGSGRLIDVNLHRADVRNAIRFIADAGKMNVVVGEGVRGTVTLKLTRVRAHDALVAVVQAHGARIEAQGNILIVRSR